MAHRPNGRQKDKVTLTPTVKQNLFIHAGTVPMNMLKRKILLVEIEFIGQIDLQNMEMKDQDQF